MGLNCYLRRCVQVAAIHRNYCRVPMLPPRLPLTYKCNVSMTGTALLIRSPTLLQLATAFPSQMDQDSTDDEENTSGVQVSSRSLD